MSFKVNWHGVEITASTIDEAFLLAKKLAGVETTPEGIPPKRIVRTRLITRQQQPAQSDKNGFDVERSTVEFLTVISDSGSRGADTERIQKALGASHPKGVGSRARYVNELLHELGFRIENVYTNERTLGEGRLWKPGPKLQDAVSKVKERIK